MSVTSQFDCVLFINSNMENEIDAFRYTWIDPKHADTFWEDL